MDNKKVDELSLFNKWKKTNEPVHFQNLYQSMKPLITEAASKASFGSNLPKSAHEIYAAQNFYDALNRYDPSKGVALQTFVYNTVRQKGMRLNYQYQNLGKIAEPRAVKVGTYNMAVAHLTDSLGRPPSSMEIAEYLHWSLSDVDKLSREIQKDYSMSGMEDSVIVGGDQRSEILNFLYYDLTSEQQLIFELIYGRNGKPKMIKANKRIDYTGISQATGFSESKIRMIVKAIASKLEKVL